jgi:hypothetical protein
MGALGFIGVLIAVLCFGSNFVPLKRLKIGDGVFFQFIMCNGIFLTAIPVLIIQDFPKIHGLAIFGGFLWCTGNMLCPIAIRLIGMGLGLLTWGTVGMLFGWASGTYGLFGLNKQEIADPDLNVAGVALSILGLLVFLQVKTNDTSVDNAQKELTSPLHNDETGSNNSDHLEFHTPLVSNTSKGSKVETIEDEEEDFFATWSDNTKKLVGIACAVCAGVFFGCSFNPSQWVIDHDEGGSDDNFNYVFPHYLGIWLTSWCYTLIYCLWKQFNNRKPYIPADCVVPGAISGVMWGIAEIAWFFANGQLGFSVTFPIISSGPGFIGSLWGIFLFKEITGTRNFMILGLAVAITLPALIMVALSH